MILEFATHILAVVEPRYWEDAYVNDVEDSDGTLIPLRNGPSWEIRIELATGRVLGWPEGVTAKTYYKVCDGGRYWLTSATGHRIAEHVSFYVPDEFLCHGDTGFGDYVILNIDAQGMIENYRQPTINPDAWMLLVDPVNTPAAASVLHERARQIILEGHSADDDDRHPAMALARAAACYILQDAGPSILAQVFTRLWPWSQSWFKVKDPRRNLVRAAALLLAQIEKMDREVASERSSKPASGAPEIAGNMVL